MRYKVINTKILVELVREEAKEGDIISSEESVEIIKGHVKEIGTGVTPEGNRIPMEVRPDSFVWFSIFNATPLPFNDKWFVIDQSDILVIEED